jgi:opacity protein-like surface antigen
MPHVTFNLWVPDIVVEGQDFTSGGWSLTEDFGVDEQQVLPEVNLTLRSDVHGFHFSAWRFQVAGTGSPDDVVKVRDQDETAPHEGYRYYDSTDVVDAEGTLTNLTFKYFRRYYPSKWVALDVNLGVTYLQLDGGRLDAPPQGTYSSGGSRDYQQGGEATLDGDVFSPFAGMRIEAGHPRLLAYAEVNAFDMEIAEVEASSLLWEAGLMGNVWKTLYLGAGYRHWEVEGGETESEPIGDPDAEQQARGRIEFSGAHVWLMYRF